MPGAWACTLHNERMTSANKSGLTGAAFATLLLIAFMMGANHVAARTAFNHGVDVVTAVTFRSLITAGVVALILWQQKVAIQFTPRSRRYLPLIGLLIAVQSVCLYSAVARLPAWRWQSGLIALSQTVRASLLGTAAAPQVFWTFVLL